MVLTRSRANSPGGADTNQGVSPPAHGPSASPPVHGAPTQPIPSTSMVPPASSAPTTITMTDAHLNQLIAALRLPAPPSSAGAMGSHSNFARCTARFDGAPTTDVVAFIDAIEIYKECVAMEDSIALRGLPMLLTEMAGTWWQGVKHSVSSWTDAVLLLRQTFGPRLPPHKVYRELFSVEQKTEKTDVFVCRARALIAQLPPNTLPENPVQLDMVYGLLHRRIREKVSRTSFSTFTELLEKARAVEDLMDEGSAQAQTRPAPLTSPAKLARPLSPRATPSAAPSTSGSGHTPLRTRSRCAYCRAYGHEKDSCQKLLMKNSTPTSPTGDKKPLICYGCGAPGVIRSQCFNCNPDDRPSASTPLQSVAAVGTAPIDARARPIVKVNVCGVKGRVIVDTGAKLSIASGSLRDVLIKNKLDFVKAFIEIKLADGSMSKRHVETVNVNVTLENVVIPTVFVILPGATDTLLGMNFIRDAGMVLDLKQNRFSLGSVNNGRTYFSLESENEVASLVCSSVALRENEGTALAFSEREVLSSVLIGNEDIFAPGGAPTPMARHHIDTGDNLPIAVPPYRLTPAKKAIVRAEIDKMLEDEIIEEAESEWASPVVLVPKKNGETRFCVDYRRLNAVTRTDKYPLPAIDDILSSTTANCVMSTIDLKAGYWQVEVAAEDRHKTAFTTPFGTFQFRRMPFGLKNSPATFQRLMDRFRSGLNDVCVVAYLDDLLVVSDSLSSHVEDLQKVFNRLRLFGLRANREKCMFARDQVTYLGHVVSAKGIQPDPDKVRAVQEMAPPSNLKQMRTFLQTCSWFRKFIPNFSEIARPLTELTKKNANWMWGEAQDRAFRSLKEKLISAPILRQPDFEAPFILRTDASAYALGAVLMQGKDIHDERPIVYASRLLCPAERNYNTTEREALAVVWALDKFRGYIEGAPIRICTDHQPLRWLMSLKTPSGRLARWAMKIQSFDLNLEYTPGKSNVVADSLSRPVLPAAETDEACDVCPISVDFPHQEPTALRAAQLEDPEVMKILKDFEEEDDFSRWTDRGYYIAEGVLFRIDPDGDSEEPQLVVPRTMREDLMKELHDAPTAGHLGVERTLKKMKERYYFPQMRQYVTQYLKACDLCQAFKPSNLKPAGLLQTPVMHRRFEVLAMDLFGPLPEGSQGEKWIFLVEDVATRWVEIFPLKEATAENCAKVLIEEVFLRYGLPRRIISDNGVQFVSAVMQKTMLVLGITQNLIPVYHPQANPAERKNREMKSMLAILVNTDHQDWPKNLPAVRFALNTGVNQGTGHTAAYLTFARELRSPIDVVQDIRAVVEAENYVPQITPYLRTFVKSLQEVRWRHEHQQDLRKAVADRSRRKGPSFREGDLVLIENHAHSHAAKGITKKFTPRRIGPFKVSRMVTPTTFEVVDNQGQVRGKYHSSALTPYSGNSEPVAAKRRGRPKSHPRRSCDLEGESIARRILPPRSSRNSVRTCCSFCTFSLQS